MMKGYMINIVATLIFIAGVVTTVIILRTYFISHTGGVETPMENLEALQAAYAVESCFLSIGGENYITSEFLDSRKGEFVSKEDFCNIPYPPIHVEVTDIENGRKWKFDRPLGDKLLNAYLTPSAWLKEKIEGIWKTQRQSSKPKHLIFIPIMHKNITSFGKNDVVFKNGGKYVIVYTKVHDVGIKGDDLSLHVYPIERYGKSLSGLTQIRIENDGNLTILKNDMEKVSAGSQKTNIIINVYKDITADDVSGSFGLASNPSDCGSSLGKKICITYFGPEIHGGKLYVEI